MVIVVLGDVVVVVEARNSSSVNELPSAVAARARSHLGIVIGDAVVIEHETLPKTSSGKVRRHETRVRYLTRDLPVLSSLRQPVHMDRAPGPLV